MSLAGATSRLIGDLTSPEIPARLCEKSILCFPIGAIEQHGPHLPLNTDVILAEAFTGRLISRWGELFDLWQLPTLSVSLSREHEWAPGTLCLSIQGFTAIVRELGREIIRSLPTRNLVIVNGHGGNRGVLEALLYELRGDCELNVCVIHPSALSTVKSNSRIPEVHGGKSETSVMLALAPHAVRQARIESLRAPPDPKNIREMIIDRGATWAWRSDDCRIADLGVIGDATSASADLGEMIVESALGNARAVLERLIENQRRSPAADARRTPFI